MYSVCSLAPGGQRVAIYLHVGIERGLASPTTNLRYVHGLPLQATGNGADGSSDVLKSEMHIITMTPYA